MSERFHVLPLGDSKPHTEVGEYCACQPMILKNIIIHNAYDGREFFETEMSDLINNPPFATPETCEGEE